MYLGQCLMETKTCAPIDDGVNDSRKVINRKKFLEAFLAPK